MSSAPPTYDPRFELFERSPRCAYCRKRFSKVKQSTIDHVIPRSKGGSAWRPSNWALACRSCNAAKADRTPLQVFLWGFRILCVGISIYFTGRAE
jgi:5-methylcytosine-specific restriction endonuclease McrA